MKKITPILVIMGFVFALWACNSPSNTENGEQKPGEDVTWTVGYLLVFPEGDNYPGGEIDLSDRDLTDISNYASVTVNATLYSDTEGNTKVVHTPATDNLVQFKLLKATGGWDTPSNICGSTRYSMAFDGDTIYIVPSEASGVPAKLLIQANWADFNGVVKSIKVNSITFTAKTEVENIIYSWGSGVKTQLFPTDTEWPGKSLPLNGATEITGTLGDMGLYKEVIINATVFDRDDRPFSTTGKTPIDPAFYTLTTAEGQWQETEIVKQYDMVVEGNTSVTPDTNKVSESKSTRWSGTPTHIVFQGQYKSDKPNDQMVGYVLLKTITFVPK